MNERIDAAMRERHARASEIFEGAVDRPAGQRREYVERSCDGDGLLLAEVLALLHHDVRGPSLEAPKRAPEGRTDPEPEVVGPFRIVRKLGGGGMGDVYLAEQREPIRRTVALKRIRPGTGSAEVLARFEYERSSLALMTHSSIARVYDAGMDAERRPYFVMEYVEGPPVTTYCERHELDVDARIELFVDICHAVEHAHRKGVIHRDLKPSNVLVANESGRAVPKVIDFGIARAVDAASRETPTVTRRGSLVGTPRYMSPEQAALSAEIDMRSDLYSLGVLLYECLVGESPLGPDVDAIDEDEIRRRVRDDDPPTASAVVRSRSQASDAASRPGVPGRELARRLRGDLDQVLAKAMEKDRERRYGSAAEMRADLERYLRREPVEAGPPSRVRRVRRFIRRNRVAVALAAVVFGAVVVGVGGTLFGLTRGLEDVRRSEKAARRAEEIAQADAKSAEAIIDFLLVLFAKAGPSDRPFGTITAAEVLDEATLRIDDDFAGDARSRARLTMAMARAQGRLARVDVALRLAEKALGLWEQVDDPEPKWLYDNRRVYAGLLMRAMRLDEAREQALLAESVMDEHELEKEPERRGRLSHLLGDIEGYAGHWDLATRHYEDALAQAKRLDDVELLVVSQSALGGIATKRGLFGKAEKLYRAAVEAAEESSSDVHDRLGELLAGLGASVGRQGRFEESERLLRRSLELIEQRYGTEHMALTPALESLAYLMRYTRRFEECEQFIERMGRIVDESLGADSSERVIILAQVAHLEVQRGNHEAALARYDEALALCRKTLGDSHLRTWGIRYNRIEAQLVADPQADFRSELEVVVEQTKERFGPMHFIPMSAATRLAEQHLNRGELERGHAILEESIERFRDAPEPGTVENGALVAMALMARVASSLQLGNRDDARRDLLEAREWIEGDTTSDGPLRMIAKQRSNMMLRYLGEEPAAAGRATDADEAK